MIWIDCDHEYLSYAPDINFKFKELLKFWKTCDPENYENPATPF